MWLILSNSSKLLLNAYTSFSSFDIDNLSYYNNRHCKLLRSQIRQAGQSQKSSSQHFFYVVQTHSTAGLSFFLAFHQLFQQLIFKYAIGLVRYPHNKNNIVNALYTQ